MTVLKKMTTALTERMLEAGMNVEAVKREMSFANQAFSKDTYLQKCSKESLAAAVINIANVGLTLNPISGESALIARYNKGQYEATLMPMYKGLVKLLMANGNVKAINTQLVYENDTFELDLSKTDNPVTIHKPCLRKSQRGELLGAYSIATLSNGAKQAEWMDIEEIHTIRNSSDSWKNEKGRKYSPWAKFEGEMVRKTVLKRITKYLPRNNSKGQELIDNAIEQDNRDYPASYNQINYIENLLMGANISPEKQKEIHGNLDNYTSDAANKVIDFLLGNQLEGVAYTDITNQKQLNKAIAEAVQNPNT